MNVTPLSADELRFLDDAAQYLEWPSFPMRVANIVGKPAELLLNRLPEQSQKLIGDKTQWALNQALKFAVSSLSSEGRPLRRWTRAAGSRVHVGVTAITGAIGGFFGLPSAALELPATTTLMLRSIAQIAARNGEDVRDPNTLLQCLEVFSFGSPKLGAMESAYLTSRLAMAKQLNDAAVYIAKHGAKGLASESAPALVKFLNRIASRFQIVVTEKLAAQAVPIVGAATGALINAAFTDHFNRVAEYHFGIVRLERRYGRETVQAAYRGALERAKRQRESEV